MALINQIADPEKHESISTPAARRRVNDNGQLVGRIGTGKGAIFHGIEVEPRLSGWTELQLVYEGPPAQSAVRRVSRPVPGVLADHLVDSHLDAPWAPQVIPKPARFSQGARQGRKH